MKFTTTAVKVLLAVVLVASACGGGDADDDELIAAISEAMAEEAPSDDFEFDANCMATGIVNELGGAAKIEETYGLTAEKFREGDDIDDLNLDEGTARDLTDAVFDCTDMAGLLAASFAQEGLDADAQACLTELIPDGALRTMMAAGFMGDGGADLESEATDELFNALFSGAAECGLG